jgi:hydroxymethylglutaryl-CoA lyase
MRNTHKTIEESWKVISQIKALTDKHNKKLVVYLSMGFGNPYGDNYHPDIVAELTEHLHKLEVKTIALSDTIGVSSPTNIAPLFSILIEEYPVIEFGAHFHTTADAWEEKVESAYQNGCRRFDRPTLLFLPKHQQ